MCCNLKDFLSAVPSPHTKLLDIALRNIFDFVEDYFYLSEPALLKEIGEIPPIDLPIIIRIIDPKGV